MEPRRTLILGAAGRDFHNFNVAFRGDERTRVVAFTATQIPNIDGRRYPARLAGQHYPEGIPIREESELEALIEEHHVDEVVFAYSDVSHEYVMHLASRVLAAGADFRLMGPESTMLQAKKPVVAICAVRTGCGKSPASRYVAGILRDAGNKVAVIRHPMPYGDLERQRVQRFASLEDLDAEGENITIEEREEYEPHIEAGHLVFEGVDYQAILAAAEEEADVILWDGGNNDLPFFHPDLWITLLDPLRAGHELQYFPGETNFRAANVIVIPKVDTAQPEAVQALRETAARINPGAPVVCTQTRITVENEDAVRGRRVLVIEDGPTLTHGGMGYGAGKVAAAALGAKVVDPRPHAVGSIARLYERFTHLERVLPAMGYYPEQLEDLQATINAVDCDAVLVATPIDLAHLLEIERPTHRVRYELVDADHSPTLSELVCERLDRC